MRKSMPKYIMLLISSCFRLQMARAVTTSPPRAMVATPKMMIGMTEEDSSGKVSAAAAADNEDEIRSQNVRAGILLFGMSLFR
jgi:hypothetical protein